MKRDKGEGSRSVKPLQYLRDRFAYMIAFVAALLLSETVLVLSVMRDPESMEWPTYLYAGLLAIFFLLIWLSYDYSKQRTYYQQLDEARRHVSELDAAMRVRAGVTQDQLAVQQLLKAQYEAFMEELEGHHRLQEMHQHFVHQWVHQMKTPISVIDLIAQQGQDHLARDSSSLSADFGSIREEAERLSRGLDLMLYTARLEKFELDLHVRRVDLHKLARQVVNTYKRLCIKHMIYPHIEGEGQAETDEKWMTFILHQLVANAIKYSKLKPGAKKLLVQIKQHEQGEVSLLVADEGIGIAEYELPRIFDPFYTGQNGRLVEESTGMGLYLTKQVCSKLGHELHVHSVPDEGTTVTVTFAGKSLHRQQMT
ncbi:sensor histidine kinase [Paenibacillus sp. GCM10027626]|uniref:sensor histidine kinase n=1 Tax=Paenibacillus sp. GCM10027626 TaxID=3273411 RepID=UPI00364077F7